MTAVAPEDDEFDVTEEEGDGLQLDVKKEKDVKTEKSKETEVVKKPVAKIVTNPKKKILLKNVLGEDVLEEDYFYSQEGVKGKAPVSFNDVCGNPVEREDLLEVFNSVFDINDNILFYKTMDKEVYIIIIPLAYSTTVGRTHESIDGDFQKHAISFISEGSVNADTLRLKLKRILPFVKFTK